MIVYEFFKNVISVTMRVVFLIPICFHAFGQGSVLQHTAKVFKAGASKSNITPFLGDEIVGGFSPVHASHIHDELYVRCLVLDDGKNKLVFGIIDNVFVKQEVLDSAKAVILERTGIPASQVMLSATHTHTATSAGGKGSKRVAWTLGESFDEYQRLVITRIADGVDRALNNLKPAEIAWGSTIAPEHVFNRRWKMKEGTPLPNPFGGRDKVKMNPGRNNPDLLAPAGPVDPEICFLAVRTPEGHPIAVLANYSLHYVGGVPAGHVSADYFGVFARWLKRMMEGDHQESGFIAMMSNGASGDVNNTNVREEAMKYPPYQKMEEVGEDVAQKVYAAYQRLEFKEWVPLSAKQTMLGLAVRKPTAQQLERAYRLQNLPRDSFYHPNEPIYRDRLIEMATNWPDTIHVPIQAFRIGMLTVGAIPFEVFAETGLELKRLSPFDQTMVIGLGNGGHGYLPTPRQHDLGGYETWIGTNRVEKQASVKIVASMLKNMEALK